MSRKFNSASVLAKLYSERLLKFLRLFTEVPQFVNRVLININLQIIQTYKHKLAVCL